MEVGADVNGRFEKQTGIGHGFSKNAVIFSNNIPIFERRRFGLLVRWMNNVRDAEES